MNLIIEGKETRQNLEQNHKKHEDMKNKLRGELAMIKDDLHQQLRRQQIEHDYEKDRYE
jgi:hypothetical protein